MTASLSETELLRKEVAGYLHAIAQAVEAGSVIGFDMSWAGGRKVESKVQLNQPVEFVEVSLQVDGVEPDIAGPTSEPTT